EPTLEGTLLELEHRLALTQEPALRFDLLLSRAEILDRSGRAEETPAVLAELGRLAAELPGPRARVLTLAARVRQALRGGQLAEADDASARQHEALVLARRAGARRVEVWALVELAACQLAQGDVTSALLKGKDAERLAAGLREPGPQAQAALVLSRVLATRSD